MNRTAALSLAAALLCLGTVWPVPGPMVVRVACAADDVPPDADAKTAKSALDRFKTEFDTVDIDYKLRAVRTVAKVQHPSVAAELMKLLKDDDANVRAAAAEGLGNQFSSASKAGGKLRKLLDDSADHPKVQLACVRSIGNLGYAKAMDEMEDLIDHEDDDIVAGVFDVYGRHKEDAAMKKMLLWWEMYPDEKEFKNVSVNVDTGTAGSGDQKAAEAKGRGKLAAMKAWRYRPKCTKSLRAALAQITGTTFRLPEDLRDYLDDPKRYKSPDLVLERFGEDDRKAVCGEYDKVVAEAKRILEEKMPSSPDDDAARGEERGKIYLGEMRKLRQKLIDEREITLSELLVILDEGKEKGWTTEFR